MRIHRRGVRRILVLAFILLGALLPAQAGGAPACDAASQRFPWQWTFSRNGIDEPWVQSVEEFATGGAPPETYSVERLPTQRLCEETTPVWIKVEARDSTLVGTQWHISFELASPGCEYDEKYGGWHNCPNSYHGWVGAAISFQDPFDLRNDLLYGADVEGCMRGDWTLDVEFGATPDTVGEITLHAFPIRYDETSFYDPERDPCSDY